MKALNVVIGIFVILAMYVAPAPGQDQMNMELIAQKPIGSWGWVLDVESFGDYVYLACENSGIQVIDPRNPQASNCVGVLRREGLHVSSLDINNGYLFAQSSWGILIVDITEPTDLQIVSIIDNVNYFDVEGDFLHAMYRDDYYIYSIADLEHPALVARLDNVANSTGICAGSGLACISSRENIQVYDVSDPRNLRQIDFINADRPHKMQMFDDYLCFITLDNNHWNVYETFHPENIHRITDFPLPNGSYDFHLFEDRMAIISGEGLVYVYDILEIPNPGILDSVQVDMHGWVPSVHYSNERIFVGQGGLFVIDATDLTDLDFLSHEYGDYGMKDMHLRNNLLYIVYNNGGVGIYNVADVSNIVKVAHIPRERGIERLAFDDDGNLYIMGKGFDLIRIFDVSDIENLRQIGSYNLNVTDMHISGDIAIAAVSREHILTLDISDPTDIREVSERRGVNRESNDLLVLGDYAYTANFYSLGMGVYDINDVANPQPLGSVSNHKLYKICGRSDYIVGVDEGSQMAGVYLFNCSDPENPIRMWGTLSEGRPQTVINAQEGRFVFTAEGESGVRSFIVLNDYRLWEKGFYDTPGSATALVADGDRLFVGDATYIQVLDVSRTFSDVAVQPFPAMFELSSPYPNPFNSLTSIQLSLLRTQNVNVNLVDINGRSVLNTNYGNLNAGSHAFSISASTLTSGLYFMQVNVGNEVLVRPIAVLK